MRGKYGRKQSPLILILAAKNSIGKNIAKDPARRPNTVINFGGRRESPNGSANMSKANHPAVEPNVNSSHQHLISWKSAFAGLLVAIMSFVALVSLGAGFVGSTAEGMIHREHMGASLATGTGLYLGFAVVVALFCGSYFALRISRFLTTKVGVAHGLVIGSAFFLILLFGLGNMIGGVASGFGSLAKSAGAEVSDLMGNPQVQDSFNRALGTSQLRTDPKIFAEGMASRFVQGDMESAKDYFAYETNQSRADVDAKVNELQAQFQANVKAAGERTARALRDTGFTLFVVFVLGWIGAMLGGYFGAYSNVERPFALDAGQSFSYPNLQTQRGSITPYIFGWILGIPFSVLLLIAMFRAIF